MTLKDLSNIKSGLQNKVDGNDLTKVVDRLKSIDGESYDVIGVLFLVACLISKPRIVSTLSRL